MIIESTLGDEKVPHRDNIFEILENNPIVSAIRWYNPIIAGGYATALFAAPRIGKPPGLISRKYYTDIDIYPDSLEQQQQLIQTIESEFEEQIIKTNVSERAVSILIKIPYGTNGKKYSMYTAQIMTVPELRGSIENVFSTYDFTASAVAIKPLSKQLFYHKDFPASHQAKLLELYQPAMLDLDTPADDVIVQMLRIHKYCKRWGYRLSASTLKRVMAVYNRQPNILLNPDKVYSMNSGDSGGKIAKSNANIWKLISSRLESAEGWDPSMDRHGIITGVKSKKDTKPPVDMDSIFKTLARV